MNTAQAIYITSAPNAAMLTVCLVLSLLISGELRRELQRVAMYGATGTAIAALAMVVVAVLIGGDA